MSSTTPPDPDARPADLDAARARLGRERAEAEARIARSRGAFAEIVDATQGSNADDEHDPEGATIAFERSQVDASARAAAAQLAEVDAALARLADGTYGTCEHCGAPIGTARLEARPVARTCVTCAPARPRR